MNDLMTVGRAAKKIGKTRMTIYRWIKSGRIISISLGGVVFVPGSEIERLKGEQ